MARLTTGSTMERDRIGLAIILRLTSAAVFALMNAAAKLAENAGAHLSEVLFWRQAVAAMLAGALIAAGPGLSTIRTERFGAHVTRAVVGQIAMVFTFYGIMTLPLAEATTIGFTIPVFATILGALVLKEATGWHRWGAVIAGFVGVLIVTAPGVAPGGGTLPIMGALSTLAGAFGTAVVSILLRSMGRSEKPLTIVFWFSLLSLLPLGIVYAFTAQSHDATTWAFMIAVGVFGGIAQLAMTGSLRLGPVSVVVPMDYSSLLWAAMLGWALFGAFPSATTWLGAPVIVASGLYIIWREHVRRQKETVQAVPSP